MTINKAFATRSERAPNVAVRERVEAEGEDAPKTLYVRFDQFNAECFAGRLQPALILVTSTGSPRTYGDYQSKDDHGLRSLIRISPHTARSGDRFSEDVLLHELVHAWCFEVLADEEGSYRGHGKKFAAKCNEIGQRLGLPEVFVRTKANKSKPLCDHWPWCVRPAGYYPPSAPQSTTTPKQPGKTGGSPRKLIKILFELVLQSKAVLGDVVNASSEAIEVRDEIEVFLRAHQELFSELEAETFAELREGLEA